jgi:hypothetical protein
MFALASGSKVETTCFGLLPSLPGRTCDYTAVPPDVRSLATGIPAAAFTNYPIP